VDNELAALKAEIGTGSGSGPEGAAALGAGSASGSGSGAGDGAGAAPVDAEEVKDAKDMTAAKGETVGGTGGESA